MWAVSGPTLWGTIWNELEWQASIISMLQSEAGPDGHWHQGDQGNSAAHVRYKRGFFTAATYP